MAETNTQNEGTAKEPRAYRAIFFDLDGTLLPMDMDEFLHRYYHALGEFVAKRGHDPHIFSEALNSGVNAMIMHDDTATNAEAFWNRFFHYYHEDEHDWHELLDEFYGTAFGKIGADCEPNPASAEAVGILREKGYPLVLTTMPLFPRQALIWRLQWAGIDPAAFARMTDYENSSSVKPSLSYYEQNLRACHLEGSDVLMVGNNTVEDYAISELGADVYLITDHLLDPVGRDLRDIKHSTMAEFVQWVRELPPCANPARDISEA